ncbi:hypothetical protein [Streptomyces sp. NBC_00623]|uniref:hypothetical protein n=1 Tax=Streptomyces sp. NBC_00623 TaxID=2975790 RepID=UPI0030DE4167
MTSGPSPSGDAAGTAAWFSRAANQWRPSTGMVKGRTYLAIHNADGDVRTSCKRLDLAPVAAVPRPRTATHGTGSRPEIAKQ